MRLFGNNKYLSLNNIEDNLLKRKCIILFTFVECSMEEK